MGSAYLPSVNNPLTFCLPLPEAAILNSSPFLQTQDVTTRSAHMLFPGSQLSPGHKPLRPGGLLHLTNNHIPSAQHTVLPLEVPHMNKWIPEKGFEVFRANLTQSPRNLWKKGSVVLFCFVCFKMGALKGNLWDISHGVGLFRIS